MIEGPDTQAAVEARVQAHHAAQVAAAAGATLLPHLDDHQNRNLGWSARVGCFVGRDIGGLQAGFRPGDLAWVVVKDGSVFDSRVARGYTLAQGLSWLRHTWVQAGGKPTNFETPGYELPDHDVSRDGSFGGSRLVEGELHRLAAAYSQADDLLRAVASDGGGSEVRLWPHHFDLATLVTVSGEGENARSVGISFTPGDAHIGEPYYSVSPWPYPKPEVLPVLTDGEWHTEGFTAAVLKGSGGAHDRDRAAAFLNQAVAAGRALVSS